MATNFTYNAKYTLIDASPSDASTAEYATLATQVVAPNLTSAISMVAAENYQHWQLSGLIIAPNTPTPAAPIVLRPS